MYKDTSPTFHCKHVLIPSEYLNEQLAEEQRSILNVSTYQFVKCIAISRRQLDDTAFLELFPAFPHW